MTTITKPTTGQLSDIVTLLARERTEAAETVRGASEYAQAALLAHFAAEYPAEAMAALRWFEVAQDAAAKAWRAADGCVPAALLPLRAEAGAPDKVTQARAELDLARAELAAAEEAGADAEVTGPLEDATDAAENTWLAELAGSI